MYRVIQENLFQEPHHEALLAALARLELPHSVHKVVPFTSRLDPEIHPEGPVMVMGAVKMARIATERGWKPGSFHDEHTFDFEIQRVYWGNRMLNDDALVFQFQHIPSDTFGNSEDHFFVRPLHDTKSFTGKVVSRLEFDAWREEVLAGKGSSSQYTVEPPTLVLVCPPKVIHWEYRVWIMDGKAVTASSYKAGGNLMVTRVVNEAALRFAEEAAAVWAPARAFVIDIAETPDGLKIIEVNNINSAGFYACNVGKLIEALEDMGYD